MDKVVASVACDGDDSPSPVDPSNNMVFLFLLFRHLCLQVQSARGTMPGSDWFVAGFGC